jgi:hypothetical protein
MVLAPRGASCLLKIVNLVTLAPEEPPEANSHVWQTRSHKIYLQFVFVVKHRRSHQVGVEKLHKIYCTRRAETECNDAGCSLYF